MNEVSNGYSQPKQQPKFSILERIAKGDDLAINECITVYGNLIWSLAKRSTKTRADAEDAVQEIFIDIWKSTSRFNPSKSPEVTFIILIAKRRLIDHIRKSSSRLQTLPFEHIREIQTDDSHHQLRNYVEAKYVFDALNQLEPRQRQVIDMQVFGGMSHNEIAEAVKLPLGTVKTHIRRGLQTIRRRLAYTELGRTAHSIPKPVYL